MGNAPFPMTRAEKIQLAIAIVLGIAGAAVFLLTVWAAVHFAVKFW